MDELAKRRFDRLADIIGKNLDQYNEGLVILSRSILTLKATLEAYMDGLERVANDTEQYEKIKEMRAELERVWQNFNADTAMPAIEAVLPDIGKVAESIGVLVNAIPVKKDDDTTI